MHFNDSETMITLIANFDTDPNVQQMIEESEQAIAQGHVYTTKQVIEMIKSEKFNIIDIHNTLKGRDTVAMARSSCDLSRSIRLA